MTRKTGRAKLSGFHAGTVSTHATTTAPATGRYLVHPVHKFATLIHSECVNFLNLHLLIRHDSLRDALYSAALSAALAPRRKVPSLIPGSRSRPADIYLPNCKRGQPAVLDVMVISTLQQQTITGTSTTQGHVWGRIR